MKSSVLGSLTCSVKGSAQSVVSGGPSTEVRDARPRAEFHFTARTFHGAER